MLEHRAPLESAQAHAGSSELVIGHADLHVAPVPNRGLLLVQSASAAALLEPFNQVFGLTLPAAQRATMHEQYTVLWLAPSEWLLEIPADQIKAIEAALGSRFSYASVVVTDLSDAFVSLEFGGASATQILMTGCSLDLEPDSFGPGQLARTTLADVPAILWRPGIADRIRCLVDRGYADHFLTWLRSASPES